MLDAWRLTSANEQALNTLAEQYGGTVVPWHDDLANPPDQFELYTKAKTIDIYIVKASVTQSLEKWGRGHLERVCTGELGPDACTVVGAGPDGDESVFRGARAT